MLQLKLGICTWPVCGGFYQHIYNTHAFLCPPPLSLSWFLFCFGFGICFCFSRLVQREVSQFFYLTLVLRPVCEKSWPVSSNSRSGPAGWWAERNVNRAQWGILGSQGRKNIVSVNVGQEKCLSRIRNLKCPPCPWSEAENAAEKPGHTRRCLGPRRKGTKHTVYPTGQPRLGFQVDTEASWTEGTEDTTGWNSTGHRRHQEKRNPIHDASVMTPIALEVGTNSLCQKPYYL